MGVTNNMQPVLNEQTKREYFNKLNPISQFPDFEIKPLSDERVLWDYLKDIPFILNFIQNVDPDVLEDIQSLLGTVDRAGQYQSKLAQKLNLFDVKVNSSMSKGFLFGEVALSAIGFFEVPLIYLAGFITKNEIPINLNQNAKWLYSAVVLGLAIGIVLAPVIAPYLGLALGGVALAQGLFVLGKNVYRQLQYKRELSQVEKDIERLTQEMREVNLAGLELTLKVVGGNALNSEDIEELQNRQIQHTKLCDLLKDKKTKQVHLTQKLKKVSHAKLMMRGIGVAMTAAVLIGLALSFSFPGVGLIIGTSVAVFGLVMAIPRVVSLVGRFGRLLKRAFKPKSKEINELEGATDILKKKIEKKLKEDNSNQNTSINTLHKNLVAEDNDDLNTSNKVIDDELDSKENLANRVEAPNNSDRREEDDDEGESESENNSASLNH